MKHAFIVIPSLLILMLLSLPVRAADPAPLAEGFVVGFDDAGALEGWSNKGDIAIDDRVGFKSAKSMRIARTLEKIDDPTVAISPAIPMRPGTWMVSGVLSSDMYSPDISYKAQLFVDWVAKDGKTIDSMEISSVSGKQAWQPFRQQVQAPDNATEARIRIVLDKAHGVCHVDELALTFASATIRAPQLVDRFTYSSPSFCNMIDPGSKPVITTTVEALKPLAENQRQLIWQLRDYWGAEVGQPGSVSIVEAGRSKRGRYAYKATIDLSGRKLEEGKYYELHTRLDLPGQDGVFDKTTLVLLPQPASKNYPPESIPFTSRNWDHRFEMHPLLSDRIGLRMCGIWGGFPADNPEKTYMPQFDNAIKLGMHAISGVPSAEVENHRRGYEKWTVEKLRAGTRIMMEKYAKAGLRMVCLGNEPPWLEERVAEALPYYKAAYEEIKKVDPSVQVIGTAVGPSEIYFKAGIQNYLDVVDFHAYEDVQGIRNIFARYHELFQKYNFTKPIVSTEIGLNSQGLSRITIAGDMIRKLSVFYALGGLHASWFDLFYPDAEGKITGSNGDSFNAFNCKYECYSPRLDAITYYNMINGILVKKCLGEKRYDNDVLATLFRDDDGNCFMTLSNDKRRQDFFLPLPGTDGVKVTRIDGSSVILDAQKKGITLSVGQDPVLLAWTGGAGSLPEAFGTPAATLRKTEYGVVQGGAYNLSLQLNGISPEEVKITAPMGWQTGAAAMSSINGKAVATWKLTAPEKTSASEGRVAVALGKSGEISFGIPVISQVSMDVLPVVQKAEGKAGVRIVARNNGTKKRNVEVSLKLVGQFDMNRNNYDLSSIKPAGAFFSDIPTSVLEIESGKTATFEVELQGLDSQTVYKVRAELNDPAGGAIIRDRMVAGFVGVPKARTLIKLDGVLDEADWGRARVLNINEERQFWGFGERKWRGLSDISGEMRVLWDDQYLYVSVRVADDVFRNNEENSMIWAGDGLQFLFDPCRSSPDKAGKYDYSLGVGRKGPQTWCTYSADSSAPSGDVPDIKFIAKRTDGKTGALIYEVAFPWQRLAPFTPGVGKNLGMAVILNDDDGKGRDCYIGWFSGVSTKMVDVIGDFILEE